MDDPVIPITIICHAVGSVIVLLAIALTNWADFKSWWSLRARIRLARKDIQAIQAIMSCRMERTAAEYWSAQYCAKYEQLQALQNELA